MAEKTASRGEPMGAGTDRPTAMDERAGSERCRNCDGRGDVMVRGLPGDEWPEMCPNCYGTGQVAKVTA